MSRQRKGRAVKAENTHTHTQSRNENADLSVGPLPSEGLWQRGVRKCLPGGRDDCHTCDTDGEAEGGRV